MALGRQPWEYSDGIDWPDDSATLDLLEALRLLLAWANIHDGASEQSIQVRDKCLAAINKAEGN